VKQVQTETSAIEGYRASEADPEDVAPSFRFVKTEIGIVKVTHRLAPYLRIVPVPEQIAQAVSLASPPGREIAISPVPRQRPQG
jgi:hypothetical protein